MGASSSPYAALQTRKVLERNLLANRNISGKIIRARPNLYDHVTDGMSVVVINLATEEAQMVCQQSGIGSLPCADPKCCGDNGRWCTKPVGWQTNEAQPGHIETTAEHEASP